MEKHLGLGTTPHGNALTSSGRHHIISHDCFAPTPPSIYLRVVRNSDAAPRTRINEIDCETRHARVQLATLRVQV